MKLDFKAVVLDAWTLFRRDRDLLLRIAGPFLFLPAFALALLVPAPPVPDPDGGNGETQALAWANALTNWAGEHGGWYLGAYLIGYIGTVLIYGLYLDGTRPDVRTALGRAATLFPRYLLAMIVIGLPAGLGLMLWIIPGLYVLGRTMLAGPLLVAQRPVGAVAAIARSLALTRGSGVALMGLAGVTVVGGWLVGRPFLALDEWMNATGQANPVARAIVDAAAAGVGMIAGLATALIAVAAYRRLAR